jgi:hypothetical protein
VETAIEQIKTKMTEVEKWPDVDKVRESDTQSEQIEANIKILIRLSALQKTAHAEFC